jgi:hypothetical protein
VSELFLSMSSRSKVSDASLATKLMIGAYVGVPAALLCSFRHLYALVRGREFTVHQKVCLAVVSS